MTSYEKYLKYKKKYYNLVLQLGGCELLTDELKLFDFTKIFEPLKQYLLLEKSKDDKPDSCTTTGVLKDTSHKIPIYLLDDFLLNYKLSEMNEGYTNLVLKAEHKFDENNKLVVLESKKLKKLLSYDKKYFKSELYNRLEQYCKNFIDSVIDQIDLLKYLNKINDNNQEIICGSLKEEIIFNPLKGIILEPLNYKLVFNIYTSDLAVYLDKLFVKNSFTLLTDLEIKLDKLLNYLNKLEKYICIDIKLFNILVNYNEELVITDIVLHDFELSNCCLINESNVCLDENQRKALIFFNKFVLYIESYIIKTKLILHKYKDELSNFKSSDFYNHIKLLLSNLNTVPNPQINYELLENSLKNILFFNLCFLQPLLFQNYITIFINDFNQYFKYLQDDIKYQTCNENFNNLSLLQKISCYVNSNLKNKLDEKRIENQYTNTLTINEYIKYLASFNINLLHDTFLSILQNSTTLEEITLVTSRKEFYLSPLNILIIFENLNTF